MEPSIEGIEVVFAKQFTTVATSQPEKFRLDIERPIAAPSQMATPTPTERLHQGQPEIAKPCIGRIGCFSIASEQFKKKLLAPDKPPVGPWHKHGNLNQLDIKKSLIRIQKNKNSLKSEKYSKK